MVKIKVCGLKREEDVNIVNKYDIDYVGFVFFPKSSRYVSFKQARYLSDSLNKDITPVGVFVNGDIDFILDLYKNNIISIAQLHGDENEEYIRNLKDKSIKLCSREICVIKSIEFDLSDSNDCSNNNNSFESNDLNDDKLIMEYENKLNSWRNSCADYFLLDSGKGSGKKFNWDLINKNDNILKKPFFLAGGLNSNNLKLAIEEFNPFAVDLSSSLEVDGFKDEDKIKEIMDIVGEFR